MKVDFNNDITFNSFRYCLGRSTYVVGHCVDYILKHWDLITDEYKKLMVDEIEKHKEYFIDSMHQCDVDDWNRIVNRYNRLETLKELQSEAEEMGLYKEQK